MDYFKLVGDAGTVYGVIRVKGLNVERFDQFRTLDWQFDPDNIKYINGANNDAEHITEDEANKLIREWTKERKGE